MSIVRKLTKWDFKEELSIRNSRLIDAAKREVLTLHENENLNANVINVIYKIK